MFFFTKSGEGGLSGRWYAGVPLPVLRHTCVRA